MIDGRWGETDSGWVGAGEDDDLDRQLLEEDDAFDRGQPHVVTALGPVEPGALGVTLAGEPIGRLALVPSSGEVDGRHEMLAELEDAYSSGVRAVAVETGDADELPVLHWLAGRVQPHLVLLAPPEVALEGAPRGAARLPEIGGVLVPEIAAPETLAAVVSSGLPVRVGAERAARRLLEAGIAPGRLSLSLPATRVPSVSGWTGDRPTLVVPAPAAGEEAGWASSVARLVDEGWGERLAVSSGIATPEQMLARGGPRGLGWTMAHLPLALMEAGLDALAVRALFIDNPARMLTIDPER